MLRKPNSGYEAGYRSDSMLKLKVFFFFVVILLLLIVPFVIKATNYTSNGSGSWSTATTWSPAGVPGAR